MESYRLSFALARWKKRHIHHCTAAGRPSPLARHGEILKLLAEKIFKSHAP